VANWRLTINFNLGYLELNQKTNFQFHLCVRVEPKPFYFIFLELEPKVFHKSKKPTNSNSKFKQPWHQPFEKRFVAKFQLLFTLCNGVSQISRMCFNMIIVG